MAHRAQRFTSAQNSFCLSSNLIAAARRCLPHTSPALASGAFLFWAVRVPCRRAHKVGRMLLASSFSLVPRNGTRLHRGRRGLWPASVLGFEGRWGEPPLGCRAGWSNTWIALRGMPRAPLGGHCYVTACTPSLQYCGSGRGQSRTALSRGRTIPRTQFGSNRGTPAIGSGLQPEARAEEQGRRKIGARCMLARLLSIACGASSAALYRENIVLSRSMSAASDQPDEWQLNDT
jgi:hypothetical protein